MNKWNKKCILCIVPSFAGISVFYIIPYLRMLYYSLIDNQFARNFVWLDNYIQTIQNDYFRLAFKNSMLVIILAVPILVALALTFSFLLSFVIRKLNLLRTVFVIPLVIPTAAAAIIWSSFFSEIDSPWPVYLLFIWKNIGICIVLLTAAFTCIDKTVFESAALDGASSIQIYIKITIPMIMPSIVFVTLLSIVNSFRIFKEIYLYYGGTNYPPNYVYTLQYYMNNNFLKLDYQSLATSAVMTSVLVFLIVLTGMRLQRRLAV